MDISYHVRIYLHICKHTFMNMNFIENTLRNQRKDFNTVDTPLKLKIKNNFSETFIPQKFSSKISSWADKLLIFYHTQLINIIFINN